MPMESDLDAAKDVLAAALGMTCPDPKDDPKLGFCRAGRHTAQAQRVVDLLRSQGYEIVRA